MVYNKAMAYPGVFLRYIMWHYTLALRDILKVWGNFFWFIGHYFSMPLLLRTFFSPWKRMSEQYQKDGLEALAEVVVVNIMSRTLGMFVRFILLLVGLTVEIFLIVGLLIFYVVWLVLPLASIVAVFVGIVLIIP
jgi:hypothetical protein